MERPYKILVIDDEQGICDKIQGFFTKRGFIVETAFDGEEGLKKLRTNEFDVAIVDIRMPKVNGIEVAQRVYQEGIDTEIIMLTGHGDRNEAVSALKAHVQDWIDKDQLAMPLLLERVKKIAEGLTSEEISRFLSAYPNKY
jgi:two-component system nitrogen regulation response regulator NtrX